VVVSSVKLSLAFKINECAVVTLFFLHLTFCSVVITNELSNYWRLQEKSESNGVRFGENLRFNIIQTISSINVFHIKFIEQKVTSCTLV